jgi:hypothetical protein
VDGRLNTPLRWPNRPRWVKIDIDGLRLWPLPFVTAAVAQGTCMDVFGIALVGVSAGGTGSGPQAPVGMAPARIAGNSIVATMIACRKGER